MEKGENKRSLCDAPQLEGWPPLEKERETDRIGKKSSQQPLERAEQRVVKSRRCVNLKREEQLKSSTFHAFHPRPERCL